MIEKINSDKRFSVDHGWLKSNFLFSFAEYHDPENTHFGTLRVFNDDLVKAGTGFPTHPHKEMEIISIINSGEITHKDSMGNKTVIKKGEVQRVTAGTGITHSEYNYGEEELNLYQIWIFPLEKGLSPSYDQKSFSEDLFHNNLFLLASNKSNDNSISLNTDANIYRSILVSDNSLNYKTQHKRMTLVYVSYGSVIINGTEFSDKDQARISEEEELNINAEKDSDFILIDIPKI